MTTDELTKLAAAECNSEETAAHPGGNGKAFWNAEAFQFMYVPAFQFQPISGCKKYRFTVKDENGKTHVFDAEKPSAMLTPIWAELPEGVVELTVKTVNEDGSEGYLAGARTFFKLSPFRGDYPAARYSYKECAARAFEYIMNLGHVRHWLEKGIPDPGYLLNAYPSKTSSAMICAMLTYSSVCPEKTDVAMKIAKSAADYLIKITPGQGSPLEGVPPTYDLDYCNALEEHSLGALVESRCNTVMTIYPSHVGDAYLLLEEKTGEKKYLDAAVKIGEFYLKTVQPNGSWFLIIDSKTGRNLSANYCEPVTRIVPFLMHLFERTGEKKWKTLADNAVKYVEREMLPTYNWEGQFEDSGLSVSYSNLTHYGPSALIRYYAKYCREDENRMKIADELMRFIEDQFVIWTRPAPWNKDSEDTSFWPVPCALEQYNWYVPIDASAANVINTFVAMYNAGRGEIHLEKAKALANTITRVQHDDGMIPTHWLDKRTIDGHNFWINCMIATATTLEMMSEVSR